MQLTLRILVVCLGLALITGCATTPNIIYPQVSKYVGSYDYKKYSNIAVLPFADAPNAPQSGQIIAGVASQIFAQSGFQVVERSRLNDILSEQKLLASGLLSDSQRIKIGQMLGVKAVVVGEVGQYTTAQRHTDTTYFPLTLYGTTSYVPIQGSQWMESFVSISLRIIDIETGALIYSGSGQYNQGLTNPPQQLAEFILNSIISGWVQGGQSVDDKNVMDGIINGGKVVRGWLGVQVQPLTRDLAKQFKLKDENGVLIVDIVEGSPAEKGGLKRGDVITEFNGRKVENPFHLKNTVASAKPGDTVKMMINRDGNVLTATVVIGELPSAKEAVPAPVLENSLKGVSVQELNEDYLRKMNITKKLRGVVVTAIEPGSPAQGILSKGDIVLELNRQLITGINDYRSVVAGIEKKQDILILLIRDSVSRYVTIPGVEK